ncbi:LuxR family transcriptional regulator [Aquipuribacter nitratireducens]|uniref:LuxR family transcriptional regulator n=1 Tax=Aquipuribacter nitratireducens TaxID=650104 RepID=A0ABW0GT81_9MICO
MTSTYLPALVREHLATARDAPAGRSAATVYGGSGHVLRHTLIALIGGRRLDEHENPGEATVHVLHGRVVLASTGSAVDGAHGDLLVVPQARHSLEALEDSVVLLTVTKRLAPSG